jgi:hypothetical protein
MPQHLGFRDRLPANFGSENNRDTVALFTDFLPPNPQEDYWDFSQSGGAGPYSHVDVLSGGVFSIGQMAASPVSSYGKLKLEQEVPLGLGTNLVVGARITHDYSINGYVGTGSWEETGFFIGFSNFDITNSNFLLGGFTLTAASQQAFGFYRDLQTIDNGFDLEVIHVYRGSKGAATEVRYPVRFSAGVGPGKFHDYGIAETRSGVIKFSLDDEDVAEFKPSNLISNLMTFSFGTINLVDSLLYPESAGADWFYMKHDRVMSY